jgi:membrane-bound serine protease (ClpP class)
VLARIGSPVLVLIAITALLAGLRAAPAAEGAPRVIVVTIDGAVTPATADHAVRGIRKAATEDAALVVLRLDTPGGLDHSMREIVKAILASPVPVASFVAPDGARAASAGTFILYASHIAAMAPATNLGAATPVSIGGGDDGGAPARERGVRRKSKDVKDDEADRRPDKEPPPGSRESLRSKQINDAAAYIRGLAELRGRNAEWGEQAVREAVSLSASEALKLKAIDVVARDERELLAQLDGRKVSVLGVERVLRTAGAATTSIEADWRTRFLMVVTDPSVAVILMMIGIYGLIFEFMSPGVVVPGVLGGICLLIALYALQLLPINYAGVALMLLGIAFIVAEAFVPSFGALGLGGVAALAIGMVVLIDPEHAPGFDIPWTFIAGVTALGAAAVFATAYLALKTRGRPVVSGREELAGAEGVVIEDFVDEGWARVHGELWRIRSSVPLSEGERVRVRAISGLTLIVEKT